MAGELSAGLLNLPMDFFFFFFFATFSFLFLLNYKGLMPRHSVWRLSPVPALPGTCAPATADSPRLSVCASRGPAVPLVPSTCRLHYANCSPLSSFHSWFLNSPVVFTCLSIGKVASFESDFAMLSVGCPTAPSQRWTPVQTDRLVLSVCPEHS